MLHDDSCRRNSAFADGGDSLMQMISRAGHSSDTADSPLLDDIVIINIAVCGALIHGEWFSPQWKRIQNLFCIDSVYTHCVSFTEWLEPGENSNALYKRHCPYEWRSQISSSTGR